MFPESTIRGKEIAISKQHGSLRCHPHCYCYLLEYTDAYLYIYTYIQIHRYKDMGIDILIYRLNLENWDVTNNLNVISAKIDRPSERTMDQTKRRHPGQVAFPGFPPIFLSKNREYHEFQNQGIFWYQSLKPHEILGVSPSQPYFVA